jgi:uncharacterized membrane protein
MIVAALVLVTIGIVVAFFPRVLAYPMALAAVWIGAALLHRGYKLYRPARRR